MDDPSAILPLILRGLSGRGSVVHLPAGTTYVVPWYRTAGTGAIDLVVQMSFQMALTTAGTHQYNCTEAVIS
eukprot:scaffold126169_cov42-Attheya_sp.AAC.1